MKKLLFSAVLGLGVLGAAQASAQDRPGMFPDPNGDGVTTKEEAIAASDARFTAMDTDKDGKLSTAEREAARAAMAGNGGSGRGMGGGIGGRADADGDGFISADEMRTSATTRFDRMDANKDGKIDKAEADAAMARMREMRGNN